MNTFCDGVLKVPVKVSEIRRPGLESMWTTEYETVRCAVPAPHPDQMHAGSGSDHVVRTWPRQPAGASSDDVGGEV